MADMVSIKNVAATVTGRLASAFPGAAAAGQASNNAAVNGSVLQRSTMRTPRSIAVTLAWSATLGANNTFGFTALKLQDSADGVTFADYAVLTPPGTVATGPAGGGAVSGATTMGVGLAGARDYLRVVYTPSLSAAAADTANALAVAIFSVADREPTAA